MGYYEATETTQYPVGSTPQLENSLQVKGCRTIGRREKGSSWAFGTRCIHGPFRKRQLCRLRVTYDTGKRFGDSDDGGHDGQSYRAYLFNLTYLES
jgi:hypothetical protein